MSVRSRPLSSAWLRTAGLALAVLGALAVAACAGDEPTPTEPFEPGTPRPTGTAAATPIPNATSVPTTTLGPSASPTPTATPAPEDFVLHIVEPVAAETLTTNPTLLVSGRTRVDAVLTVNDTFVEPDIDGLFSTEITLDEGPNVIEVVASIATGEQLSAVLAVIYEP